MVSTPSDDPREPLSAKKIVTSAFFRALSGSGRSPAEVARQELLELAITAAGVGTFDWSLVDGTLEWDDRLVDIFGYDRATFDRSIEAFYARLHPEDRDRVAADIESAMDGDGDGEFESEYRVVLPGGATRWIGARGRALRDEDGKPVRLLGAAWDNSVRVQNEARAARVMESMNTAFFSLDASWRFTYINAEGETVLGRKRAELIGGVIWDLFPGAVGSDFDVQYRHTMSTGEHVAFDAYYPAPLDAWYEVRAWRTTDGIAVYFLDVTARHQAQVAAERAAERTALLARITEELSTTSDSGQAASRLANLVVPTLADWCIVTMVDDAAASGSHRGLGEAVAVHSNPALQETVERYAAARLGELNDDALVIQIMQTGQPLFIESGASSAVQAMFDPGVVQALMAKLAPESVAVLPISGGSGPVALLTLCNGVERGMFSDEDMVTATHVAARAGLVMENSRLYRQQLTLAEALQRSLLTDPPASALFDVVVRYLPAAEAAQVGGDWYDAFVQPDGATVLVIGDVVGHDSDSAAAMSQIRTLLRGVGASENYGPADILRRVDRVIETLQVDTDATAVVARLEHIGDTTRLRWSNAGHLPVIVVEPDGSASPLISATPDVFLGVVPDCDRHEYETVLEPGCTIFMYTDGLVERRGQHLEEGLAVLQQTLAEFASSDVELDKMCDETLRRLRPSRSEDDVAMIAVRLNR
jgi:serine phosphatase RsbU (regulator of sigma subunit)/PAS domain-containing protein